MIFLDMKWDGLTSSGKRWYRTLLGSCRHPFSWTRYGQGKDKGNRKPQLLEIFPHCDVFNWHTLLDLKVGGFLCEENNYKVPKLSQAESQKPVDPGSATLRPEDHNQPEFLSKTLVKVRLRLQKWVFQICSIILPISQLYKAMWEN